MSEAGSYPGSELALFADARNWKGYLAASLRPFLGRRVLEVGAGMGSTTEALTAAMAKAPASPPPPPKGTASEQADGRRWVCLEPDRALCKILMEKRRDGRLPPFCEIMRGTLADLAGNQTFDAILYVDVLEHIEDDGDELRAAGALLAEKGALVALSPAFPRLFTPFDAAIGHHRRYTRRMYRDITPPELEMIACFHLDSVGLLASLANRLALKSAHPTRAQIQVWDRYLVPPSRFLDPLSRRWFGRSVVGVWKRRNPCAS